MFAQTWKLIGMALAMLTAIAVSAGPTPWVLALDKAQGDAPLVLVLQERDGTLTGAAYISPTSAAAVAADVTKLTRTETALKGEVTVTLAEGTVGTYALDATVRDGALTGRYTGTTGDVKVAGTLRWGADLLPLGHALCYPSADQPIGWQGDGNGAFPGATPVTQWREGASETRRFEALRTSDYAFTDTKTHNIVWKTEMPGWTGSSPIVVGDRVFTLAEPHTLVCVDARNGKIIWQAANSPFAYLDLSEDDVKKYEAIRQLDRAIYILLCSASIDGRTGALVRHTDAQAGQAAHLRRCARVGHHVCPSRHCGRALTGPPGRVALLQPCHRVAPLHLRHRCHRQRAAQGGQQHNPHRTRASHHGQAPR